MHALGKFGFDSSGGSGKDLARDKLRGWGDAAQARPSVWMDMPPDESRRLGRIAAGE